MLKILVNAYACSPNMGSEPGMAWNWCSNLAKYCELFIITEEEFRDKIEAVVPTLPQGKNMHFYYNPVTEKVRQMCWNQGDWRFYWHYRQWQKRTLSIAKQICSEQKINIIHHLNMICFREPGLLWKMDGYKYVWGPVGGMEIMPVAYLKGAGMKAVIFNRIKNTINTLQYKFQPNFHRAIKRSDAIIAATRGCQEIIQRYYKGQVSLINETGCYPQERISRLVKNSDQLDLMWCGKFDFRKRLDLAIRIIAELKGLNVRLHVAGSGDKEKYLTLAQEHGVEDKIVWHGQVNHEEINSLMQQSDVFLFTSIMDATSTVVMEAIQNQLPVVCFDTCGFGTVVDETIGVKIHLSNPEQSVKDFADELRILYGDRQRLSQLSENCKERIKLFEWDYKAQRMVDIYNKCLEIK